MSSEQTGEPAPESAAIGFVYGFELLITGQPLVVRPVGELVDEERRKERQRDRAFDGTFVPSNFGQLVERYGSHIRRWVVVGEGVHEVDDAVQQIFLRMLERDIIGNFDPSKASFGTALYAFVRYQRRSIAKAEARRAGREVLLPDVEAWMSGEAGEGAPAVRGDELVDDVRQFECVELSAIVKEPNDGSTRGRFLDACRQVYEATGEVRMDHLGRVLGISAQMARRYRQHLDRDSLRMTLAGE